MNLLRYGLTFCLLCLSFNLHSRSVDPAWLVDGKSLTNPVEVTWIDYKNKITRKVKKWWGKIEKKAPISRSESLASKDTEVSFSSKKDVDPTIVEETNDPVSSIRAEEVSELAKSLPDYSSDLKETSKGVLNKVSEVLSGESFTVKSGRSAQSDLTKSKNGVPQFSLYRKKNVKSKNGKVKTLNIHIKSIPLLDLGEESRIEANNLIPEKMKLSIEKYKTPKRLKTEPLLSKKVITKWKGISKNKKLNLKKIKNSKFGLGKLVTSRKIEKLNYNLDLNIKEGTFPVHIFTTHEIKMLSALILYAKGKNCHLVSGLFFELLKKKDFFNEANFYLGACSQEMGFYSEAVNRLLITIRSESPVYASDAISLLLKKIPLDSVKRVSNVLRNLKNKKLISEKSKDAANYYIAKGLYLRGKFKYVSAYSEKISIPSEYYLDGKYLTGISQYAMKNELKGLKTLDDLSLWMKKNNRVDKNLNTLISLNLGRISYRKGQYKKSLKYYQKIHKDHPLWIQGLVEMGWVQLRIGDYSGAIGNMYSLHSPFFASVFLPESHVVRVIGYLNICQYGDAYRSLNKIEKIYGDHYKEIQRYIKKTKLSKDYYGTLVKYLRSKKVKSVDGLQTAVIRELGRHRDYLNYQKSLNLKQDELSQLSFIESYIVKDKARAKRRIAQAVKRVRELKLKIAKAQTNNKLKVNLDQWRKALRFEKKNILSHKYKVSMYDSGKKGFVKFKRFIKKRMKKENYVLREKAGRSLVKHMIGLSKNLELIISGNEFLRYEIFSGSGENIRFQVAGGKSSQHSKRISADVKPEKLLNWEFDGEYWEDEIGSYRSSLKNNCPNHKVSFNTHKTSQGKVKK